MRTKASSAFPGGVAFLALLGVPRLRLYWSVSDVGVLVTKSQR